MTDITAPAVTPLTADEEAQLSALQARASAAAQAKADAARTAVKGLVAGDVFKAALAEMETALGQAPKVQELSYAVNMMERLANDYAA